MAEPEAPTAEATQQEQDSQAGGVDVQEAQLPEAAETSPAGGGGGNVDILLDTILQVTASLGQREMTVRELLQLGPGSVLTVDTKVGEPVALYLRGTRFASGHLVVVEEQLGVRIAEIAKP